MPPPPSEQPPPPVSRPSRRARARAWRRHHPRLAVSLVAGCVALVIAGAFLWRYLASYESTDDAQVDGHISPMSARVAGTVTAVFVDENQPVKKGQVLVELDARDYQVALARAEADLDQARALLAAAHPNLPITRTSNETRISSAESELASTRAAVAGAERDRQAALARLTQARADEVKAHADINRYRFLLNERAVPKQLYDDRLAAARVARAGVTTNRALARAAEHVVAQQQARLDEAVARLDEAGRNAPHQEEINRATVDAREAAVESAQAAVKQARLNLEYTRVVAPFDGVVGRRTVEVGAHVAPGQQLLAIVDVANLWVTANFKETQLRHMRPGARATIRVDASGRRFDGYVESLPGASGARFSLFPPENATGNYVKVVQRLPVRIRFNDSNNESLLRPGMSVVPKVDIR